MSRFDIAPLHLGALTLTPLVLGVIEDTPQAWFADAPFGVSSDRMQMPVFCLHIAGPECSVLIDACDPSVYPIAHSKHVTIQTALDDAGISPDAISHVLLTHGHHDHFCGVWDHVRDRPNFPRARHVLSSRDWGDGTLTQAAQFADGAAADPRPLERLFRLGLLDVKDCDVALPTGIALLDAPGETDGHKVVQVTSQGMTFFFLADLFHVRAEIHTPELCPIWADGRALPSSRSRIAATIQRTNARFMCSHIAKVFGADELGGDLRRA